MNTVSRERPYAAPRLPSRLASLASATALLCGCTVGPNYRPPDIPVPKEYASANADAAQPPAGQHDVTDAELSNWWQQFQDPQLQSLIKRAFESNLDLQTAASRIRQARAQEIIAGAAGLPNLNATGLGAYIHSNSNPLGALAGGSAGGTSGSGSGDAGGGGGASSGSDSSTLKLFSAGFDATWELDVFGGVRRGVEAAHAAADAAVWQMRDAEVSLSAEVAVDYLTLCATRVRLDVVRNAIQRQQQILDLTEARRRAGFVTELDVNQQRAQLATTVAQLPSLEAEARAMTHAIAVLLAQEPESITGELQTASQLPNVPSALPVGLPSDLLRRRPDIRMAERRLGSATAEVGVAVAELYPNFDLIGAATYASNSVNGLVSSRNLTSVGAGLIRWPVFQGGRAHANVTAQEEQRQQAYLAYQKSVLTALQDADDALVRFSAEQHRLTALLEAESAATSSLEISRSQYENGVTTFISVLNANTTLLDVQNQIAQSRMAVAQTLVSLYKALGGGWRVEGETVAAAAPTK